ncbi:MAG: glycosyltransferase family 39 protein [Sphingobacteriales bacterium]|nr:MAG: glycosyltransferase family 39 protein [Sphingobacteriales bacterium]
MPESVRSLSVLESTDATRLAIAITLLAAVLYLPFLGAVSLFDWDEVNFAESAREMLVSGNYGRVQIGFKPFWEKPPLFFWMQALAMKMFGINEFAARLPNALFGILTLFTLFYIGKQKAGNSFGVLWALLFGGSILPMLYFKSGIIDPVFNYFIFISLFFLSKAHEDITATDSDSRKQAGQEVKFYAMAGVGAGLAVLTKGPVGLLLILLTAFSYYLLQWWKKTAPVQLKAIPVLLFLLCTCLVASLWFGVEVVKHGPSLLKEFVTYQVRLFSTSDAGHAQPLYYHWVVVFLGCFPLSVFALPAFFRHRSGNSSFALLMKCLFFVVMILFTIVKTKIVHYSSMAYLPLSFLAVQCLHQWLSEGQPIPRFVKGLFTGLGLLWATLLIALPFFAGNIHLLLPYIKDPFAAACFQTTVEWHSWGQIIGVAIAFLVLTVSFTMSKHKYWSIFLMLVTFPLLLGLYFAVVAPKIELYTQAPAIRFYKEMAGKPVYVEPIGFKSYAHLFYFGLMPGHRPEQYSDEWLLTGEIDRPAYLITKINRTKLVTEKSPDSRLLKTEGGFVFFEKLPKKVKSEK